MQREDIFTPIYVWCYNLSIKGLRSRILVIFDLKNLQMKILLALQRKKWVQDFTFARYDEKYTYFFGRLIWTYGLVVEKQRQTRPDLESLLKLMPQNDMLFLWLLLMQLYWFLISSLLCMRLLHLRLEWDLLWRWNQWNENELLAKCFFIASNILHSALFLR